jgi:hypothetical protein
MICMFCYSLLHVFVCAEGEGDGVVTWNVPARAVAAVAQCLAADEDPIVRYMTNMFKYT